MIINKDFQGTTFTNISTAHARADSSRSDCNNTYELISKVAYLIGVPEKYFAMEYEPPKTEYFDMLQRDKNARIIRNLCILRTAIERNYGELNYQMRFDIKNLNSFPEMIPQDCLKQLEADGFFIIKANCKLNQYIIEINRLIMDRINNCKMQFPIWLEWKYVRELFIMPNGSTEAGIKAAAAEYYANLGRYPYQVYINWTYKDAGNILYNDKKFASLLYEAHKDTFTDCSKVEDASDRTKESIYRFLDDSEKTAIIVDCENSDPFKLCATLKNLDYQALLSKIKKIILCDDVNTTSAWDVLKQFTDIPVEHVEIPRVTSRKSLVDASLCVKACTAHFQEGIDSFVLFGSDSDYWSLFNYLKTPSYYVMVEAEKFGGEYKDALTNAGIPFCYIDHFCTGNSNELKTEALLCAIRDRLENAIQLNINEMLKEAYISTRAEMSKAEEKQFFDRYIKPMHLVVGTNGAVSIAVGR